MASVVHVAIKHWDNCGIGVFSKKNPNIQLDVWWFGLFLLGCVFRHRDVTWAVAEGDYGSKSRRLWLGEDFSHC